MCYEMINLLIDELNVSVNDGLINLLKDCIKYIDK